MQGIQKVVVYIYLFLCSEIHFPSFRGQFEDVFITKKGQRCSYPIQEFVNEKHLTEKENSYIKDNYKDYILN